MILQLLDPINYSFSLYSIPTFVTAAAILSLGVLILLGERHSPVSISFFLMTAAVGIWLFGYSWAYCVQHESLADAWVRISHLGVTFIPASVYHFTVGTLRIYSAHKRLVWLSWATSAAFLATVVWTDLFIAGVYRYWWGFYAKYDWMSFPFLGFFFGMMAASLRHFWVEFNLSPSEVAKLRSKALLIAFSVAYLGSVDYLAAFGVSLYPFGYLPVLVFIVMTASAIWRYRLVDITPAFAANEIINAMADALLVLDHDGIVRVANRAACDLFEKTEKEIVGTPIRDLTSAISQPERGLDRLLVTGSLRNFESRMPNRGEAITVLSTSSYVMHDQGDRPIAFVCIVRNVTEQKRAEQEIQHHVERQAALYEINLATTSTLELQAVLNVLLERLKQLIPHAAITIMLLSSDDQRLIKVASRNIDDETWKRDREDGERANAHPVLERKSPVFISDLRTHSNGWHSKYFIERAYVSYLGVPLVAKDQVLGVLSFYTKEERSYSSEELNFLTTLAGQTASAIHNSQLFEQTRQQASDLEEANRVKDEFLSVMSHELRTPLNIIAGFTKIVQDGMLGKINAEQGKALEKVTRHSNELLVMVNSIMDATKIEAGALVIDNTEFQLSEFFEDLKLLYDYSSEETVKLKWDLPETMPTLTTDKEKLKHILQNLINNALKFTEKGSVTVALRHFSDVDKVEFKVTDTGIGIERADLSVIFEMFRQLDSSKTRSRGGVGLGLHIVKTFTALLGGTVRAESAAGKGSTFTVSLPCATRPDGGAGSVEKGLGSDKNSRQ